MRSAIFAAVLLAAMACVPEEGPLMAPNQDCLGCHGRGEGPTWTVAGTYGGKGSRVTITDANGRSFTVRTAENGNFYTAESVAFPITVSVDGKPMANDGGVIPVTYGGCNLCHGPGGVVLALDEFMAPGVDCLGCHDGTRAKPAFTAAGTWSGPGQTVRVSDRNGGNTVTMTTNRVGNFYTSSPITLPGIARVGNETMDDPPLEYGGCNRCHPFGSDADD